MAVVSSVTEVTDERLLAGEQRSPQCLFSNPLPKDGMHPKWHSIPDIVHYLVKRSSLNREKGAFGTQRQCPTGGMSVMSGVILQPAE